MARVAESAMARLGCSLVEAHLQVELSFVGPELLIGELAFVLVRHLGS